MFCRTFTSEQDDTTSTVLKTSLPTVIVGVLKEFYASTPKKGDLFVIDESYRHRLSKYIQDAFTVTSVKRKANGTFSVNLAGKLICGEHRHRFSVKLWSVDMPDSDCHGNTAILHDRIPYFLVRKCSPDYEKVRPKDYVAPKKTKRDARKHFRVGDVLYRDSNYDQNGRLTYTKFIVEKVTACYVKLVGETQKIKVSYLKKTQQGLVAYLFDGFRSYNKFENR